nr:hypothetical protein [Tanacetum cinerariifolium]
MNEILPVSASNNTAIGYKHSLAEKDAKILHLNDSPLEFASFLQGGFQSFVQKFLTSYEFSRVQGELLSLSASRLIDATPIVATKYYPFLNMIVDYSAHPLCILLELEPEKLVRPATVPAPKVASVSPSSLRESTVTPAFSSMKFLLNDAPTSSAGAVIEQPPQEKNEEWVNAMIDTSDEEMVDAVAGKSAKVLVQGVVHQLCEYVKRVYESLIQDSELASSGSSNVIVALFAEKEKENPPLTPKILLWSHFLPRLMLRMLLLLMELSYLP